MGPVAALPHGRTSASKSGAASWDPAHTWVFAVGLLQFQSKDFDSFPAAHRRDATLVKAFRKRGVPDDHIVYLQDKTATLKAIRKAFKAELARTQPGDTLLFYYCGHGFIGDDNKGPHYFAPYDAGDTGWDMKSVVTDIDANFRGNTAILMADCCESGALADDVHNGRIAYAAITSAQSCEASTGNWTFTQDLLDAFRGTATVDLNKDGHVDFTELGQYAHQDMLIYEGQLTHVKTTNGFDTRLTLSDTRPVPHPHFGERIQAKDADGEWDMARVVEVRGQQTKIRWLEIGYDTASSDEWKKASEVRPIPLVQFPVGSHIQVHEDDTWYTGHVLKVEGSAHFVHYDDYGAEYDEWVSADDMKPYKEPKHTEHKPHH